MSTYGDADDDDALKFGTPAKALPSLGLSNGIDDDDDDDVDSDEDDDDNDEELDDDDNFNVDDQLGRSYRGWRSKMRVSQA